MPSPHPTWTFRPNWSSAILDRYEWRTALLASETGATQAVATRFAPRRSIEAAFLLNDAERAFFSLTLQRRGSEVFQVPLWFNQTRLTASVLAGAISLPCDTVDREFRPGDFALLVGPDAFGGETVEIGAVSAGALTLVDPVAGNWPQGTRIHPLRPGLIDGDSLTAPTSRVMQGTLRFLFDAGNDVAGGVETWPLLAGYPVVTQRVNWAQDVGLQLEWLRDEFDSETGLRTRFDRGDRAFASTRYSMMLIGRAEQAAFRALLTRLRGRQGMAWIPGLTDDYTAALPALSGASEIEVERIGLLENGGVSDATANALFGTDLPVTFSALLAPTDPTRERLSLAAPLVRDLAAGETARQLRLCRLEQDSVTVRHETDTVATVNLTWKDTGPMRNGAASGGYPIPTASMTAGGCCDEASQWVERTSPADNNWTAVAWSPELAIFAAVSQLGSGNRVATSPDGINWTLRTSAANSSWNDICWSPALGLFVAVSGSSIGRCMTSPDGINWTLRTVPAKTWRGVTWSPDLALFVAVGLSDTDASLVMTSPDGINWTLRTALAGYWKGVVWSPELALFCAVEQGSAANTWIMTSPNGVNWTARTKPPAAGPLLDIAWSPTLGLFCAPGSGTNNGEVITSSDGINWTLTTGLVTSSYRNISWSPERARFVIVGPSASMISADALNWTFVAPPNGNIWQGLDWSPTLGLFVATAVSGTGNQIMTWTAEGY